MEDVGIDRAVLYTTQGLAVGKIFHADWAIALTTAYNNWVHETYLTRSPRFQAMALLPMQDPSAAVDELHRAVEELGFCGAMLPSTGLKDHLGAKEFWPVYEAADKLGCALGIHGGAHSGFGFDHMNLYTPVGALGHPFGLLVNFAGVVFNGVLDKFPNTRWGFMEGGVGWLHLASGAIRPRPCLAHSVQPSRRADACAGREGERLHPQAHQGRSSVHWLRGR